MEIDMSGNPAGGFAKKVKGYVKEVVAEVTGDASLQSEGRKLIAEGKAESTGRLSDPRHNDRPESPRR